MMAETPEEVAKNLDIPVGIRARRMIASALRAQYVAGLEAGRVAAATEQRMWEHSDQAWGACGNIAEAIRELAEQAKREGT